MRFLPLGLLLLCACGGAMAGAPCTSPGTTECSGSRALLVCEGTRWASYPCPSCSGTVCNWKGAANGDSCPRAAETQGTCNFDGRVISCFFSTTADAGVFVESACPACMAGKSLDELGKCSGARCSCN